MWRRRKTCVTVLLVILTISAIVYLDEDEFTSYMPLQNNHIQTASITEECTSPVWTPNTTLRSVTNISGYDQEWSFDNFSYPLDVDMMKLVQEYKRTGQVRQCVINKFKQDYLQNPVNRCFCTIRLAHNYTSDVFLLLVVKSKSDHFEQRKAIRETWGNEHYLKSFNIKTVFILGTPVNESLIPIWNEIQQFNDIILMDFHDTYFNNTLKTSTAFNWVPEFCPCARFVVLVDDDIYVSLETLVSYLDNLPSSKRVQLYMGHTFIGYEPHRNNISKWYVPVTEYPWDAYPPFISAGTVIMTMDFVMDVRIAMRYTELFRLDDIYLAILAYKLGVTPVTNTNVYGHRVMFGNKAFSHLLTSHGFSPEQLKRTWNTYIHSKKKTSTLNKDGVVK